MPSLTADKIFALASLLTQMAGEFEKLGRTYPRESEGRAKLRAARQFCTNASTELSGTGIQAALDEVGSHYDAMIGIIRDLDQELDKEAHDGKIFAIVDSVIAITTTSLAGNVPGMLAALDDARKLICPAKSLERP